MIETVWFLVVLLSIGDHVALERMPVEFPTQMDCSTAGMSLMIDRRNRSVNLYCIEADDEDDLVVIMNQAFTFAGQGV